MFSHQLLEIEPVLISHKILSTIIFLCTMPMSKKNIHAHHVYMPVVDSLQ